MTAPVALIDRYIAAWNATDAEDRRDLIAGTWTDGARYVDPLMEGQGHAGIDAMVKGVQDRFPDHRFKRTSDIDAHNQCVRFTWELGAEGADPIAHGVDFGVVAADGRLESITGFLDFVAAQPG
jgi:SnoaL-like domain